MPTGTYSEHSPSLSFDDGWRWRNDTVYILWLIASYDPEEDCVLGDYDAKSALDIPGLESGKENSWIRQSILVLLL